MMAAIAASEYGADVTLFEKNEKLGKKMYINPDHIISLEETNKLLGGAEGVEEEKLNELRKTSTFGDYIFKITLINGKIIKIAENIEHFKKLYGINILRY